MTDTLCTIFIVAIAIIAVVFDIWIVWKRGGDSTISWVLDVWWTTHPFVMVSVFALIGHIFFPMCRPPAVADSQSIGPAFGSVIGILGIVGILGWAVYVLNQPPLPNGPKLSRLYLVKLAALALAGMAFGHFAFAQYVECIQ